ncbi:hypothetical protein RF11_06008 [Thelohanellus kitauei]|uniref:Uncharacterized protein n=1 Tax=Thelohanellus kitauei TaxID=669202 RepID=A0A0C2MFK3_THEKT|nr:hypothetical protein RF11_06008 [Thelohanellus kitauei]
MLISAECNYGEIVDEYYRAKYVDKNLRDQLFDGIYTLRAKDKGMNTGDSFLIEQLKKQPDLKKWMGSRILIKMLRCYLKNGDVDKFVNSRIKHSQPASNLRAPTCRLTVLGLAVGCVSVAILIFFMLFRKNGIITTPITGLQSGGSDYEKLENEVSDA